MVSASCDFAAEGGRKVLELDLSPEVFIIPISKVADQLEKSKELYMVFPDGDYRNVLINLYGENAVAEILRGSGKVRMDDLVKRQFVKSAELFVSLGRDGFIRSKKVQELFNSSDKRVLGNIYNDIFVKIHESCKGFIKTNKNTITKLTDFEVNEILSQLDFDYSAQFYRRIDLFQYIQSTLIHAINGREIIARRLLEGTNFVFPNPNILNDFSGLGIARFSKYSEDTKNLLQKELEVLHIISSGAEINHETILNILTKVQLKSAELFGFTTLRTDNRGTDLIQKINLENVLDFIYAGVSADDIRIVTEYLKAVNHRRMQIFEFKVSAKKSGYDTVNALVDVEGRGFDMGLNFLERSSADYGNFIDRLNRLLSERGFDGLFFKNKMVENLFDFENFFCDVPDDIIAQRIRLHDFLKSGQRDLLLDSLKGSKLQELMNAPNLWSNEIRDFIVDFIDAKLFLNDAATIEEFLFSGKIKHVNYISNEIEPLPFISFDVRLPDGDYGKLEINELVHVDDNGEIMFGFDVFKDNLRLDSTNNPFIFTNEELKEIIQSEKVSGMVHDYLDAIENKRIYSNMASEKEKDLLKNFILRHEDLDYYFSKDANNEFRFMKELPVTVINYLKQELQRKLFKNQDIGLISHLDGLPYEIVKGISGTGRNGFFIGASRLLDYRYIFSSSYDELAFSSRRGLGVNIVPELVAGPDFVEFLPLMDDLNKAKLGYGGKRWINSKGKIIPFDIDNGGVFKFTTIKEWIVSLKQGQIGEFAEAIQSGRYTISNISPYNYRNPSQIVEVLIKNLEVTINGKRVKVDGIFPDLSRPIQGVQEVTRLDKIADLWINSPTTSSFVYWKSALETLSKSGTLFSETDRIRIYNEMIYLADQRTKIGSFLNPIFEILDEKSIDGILHIAQEHADSISDALKNCPSDHYACNMIYSFKGVGRLEPKEFPMIFGNDLPDDFKFVVNENNAMTWYIDKIIRDNNFNGISLSFVDTPENRKIIEAVTLKKVETNTFSLHDVVLGKYNPTLEENRILVESKEGIIRYFGLLERRARTQCLNNMLMARIALKDFLKTKTGKDLPYEDIAVFINQAPIVVLPPNIVRSPSGFDIPFIHNSRSQSELSHQYIPIAISVEILKEYLNFIDHGHLFDEYSKLIEETYQFVTNVDQFVNDVIESLDKQMLNPKIIPDFKEIITGISTTKIKNSNKAIIAIKELLNSIRILLNSRMEES